MALKITKTLLLLGFICAFAQQGDSITILKKILSHSEATQRSTFKNHELEIRIVQRKVRQYDSLTLIYDSLCSVVKKRAKKKDSADFLSTMRLSRNRISEDVYKKVRELKTSKALALNAIVPLTTLYRLDRSFSEALQFKLPIFTINNCPDTSLAKHESNCIFREIMKDELLLMQLTDKDVIADIGAGSGELEEMISAICEPKEVHATELPTVPNFCALSKKDPSA